MPSISRCILFFNVLLPLFIGGLIYVLFRALNLKMFRWFEFIGLSTIVQAARQKVSFASDIPDWIIFSLPDALWLFAFTNLMLQIWHYKISRQSFVWITLAPAIGIFSELGQAAKLVPGTFDFTDLSLLCIASIIPFIYPINQQLNLIPYEKN